MSEPPVTARSVRDAWLTQAAELDDEAVQRETAEERPTVELRVIEGGGEPAAPPDPDAHWLVRLEALAERLRASREPRLAVVPKDAA